MIQNKKRKRHDLFIQTVNELPCVNCKTLTKNYHRNSICCCSISCFETYILKLMNEQAVLEQQRGGNSFEEIMKNDKKDENDLILFDSSKFISLCISLKCLLLTLM